MNYISLINNFWLLSEEHDFRPIDIALYFYFLKVANGLLWKPSFRRNNREVMEKFNISSHHTFNEARNRLKIAGLIDYKTYNGKKFSTYTIIDTLAKDAKVTAKVTAKPYNNKTKTKTETKENIKKPHPIETELSLNVDTPKKQMVEIPPPSIEDVIAICTDKGMSEEEAKNFYYYYDAQGWVTTGGQKIKRIDSMVNRWLTNGKGKEYGRNSDTNIAKREARNKEVIDEVMSHYT